MVRAARQVAGADPAALDSLLDKSLLQTSPARRLDLHLTLREYAAEKLAEHFSPWNEIPLHQTLSDREYRVMLRLAAGKRVSDIGREMFLSPSTISSYRVRVLRKLKLRNNAELVVYAAKYRLVS